MTDDDHLDELASAYLDGAASPDEAAVVGADPALQARVAAMAEVRAALQQVVAAPADRRDAALAAARAAFEAGEPSDASPAAPAPLRSPAARWRWSPRTVRLVGAAAVVLLLAAVVPVLSRLGDDDDSQAARFEETGAAIGGSGQGADRALDGAPAEDSGAVTTTAGAAATDQLGHLGEFSSVEEAFAALAQAVDQALPAPTQMEIDVSSCPPPTSGPRSVASAVVDGEPVVVLVEPAGDDDGGRTATAYRVRDCRFLDRASIP